MDRRSSVHVEQSLLFIYLFGGGETPWIYWTHPDPSRGNRLRERSAEAIYGQYMVKLTAQPTNNGILCPIVLFSRQWQEGQSGAKDAHKNDPISGRALYSQFYLSLVLRETFFCAYIFQHSLVSISLRLYLSSMDGFIDIIPVPNSIQDDIEILVDEDAPSHFSGYCIVSWEQRVDW